MAIFIFLVLLITNIYFSYYNRLLGLKFLIIFFSLFLLIRFYFANYGLEYNSVAAAWVDITILGLCIYPLSKRYFSFNSNISILMYKLILLFVWFSLMFAVGLFNSGFDLIALEKYRRFALFPIISWYIFILVKDDLGNLYHLNKYLIIICCFGLFFTIFEQIQINIRDLHPSDLPYIKNTSLATYDSYINPVYQVNNLLWNKGFGLLMTPHSSAHLLVIGALIFFSKFKYGLRKSYIIPNYILLFLFVFMVFISFVKTAWLMLIAGILFLNRSNLFKLKNIAFIILLFTVLRLVTSYVPEIINLYFFGIADQVSKTNITELKDFLNENNLISLVVGNGFVDSKTMGSFSETFILEIWHQIGLVGLIIFGWLVLIPIFHSYSTLSYKFKEIVPIILSFKSIILISLVSTGHYETILNALIQAMFYLSVGSLYALSFWEVKLKNRKLSAKG